MDHGFAPRVPDPGLFFHSITRAAVPPARPAIVTEQKASSWGELAALTWTLEGRLAGLSGRRVGVRLRATAACLAALAVLDQGACDAFLLDPALGDREAEDLGRAFGLAALFGGSDAAEAGLEARTIPGELPGSGRSTVTILTSGTTGKPKAARHTWASLVRPVRVGAQEACPCWLLTYRPHLYAGLQVMLQCLLNGGTLVAPEAGAAPAGVAGLMTSTGVQFASATPSYWRRLLLFADHETLRQAPLQQITLGGEVIDQQVLDALRKAFPAARLVHIYATTELGRCFSVTDGWAGFPARFFDRPSADGVELRLVDGELCVRSANAMESYDVQGAGPAVSGEWRFTGDLVEVRGDRAYFVGRRSDMINVGGNKVHPIEVERVIRAVPGVADVHVYGKRSSIAGELVVCDVVPCPGANAEAVSRTIQTTCLEQLNPYQRPRLIEFRDEIGLADSGKIVRRKAL